MKIAFKSTLLAAAMASAFTASALAQQPVPKAKAAPPHAAQAAPAPAPAAPPGAEGAPANPAAGAGWAARSSSASRAAPL